MFELFVYQKHINVHPINKLSCQLINDDLTLLLNKFLYFSCKYLLVNTDSHFTNYIPIILVILSEEGNILGLCELMYNSEINLLEIYNICIHPKERRKNHCKNLLDYILTSIQPILKCDLWIAVSTTNPMYDIATRIYQNSGFTDDVKKNMITPSGILYENGFLEMYKYFTVNQS